MAEGSADERLVVMLEARISEFEKRMAAAERRGTRTYTGLQRGSARATAQMEADAVRAAARVNQALASVTTQVGGFSRAFIGGIGAGLISAALAGISSDIRRVVGDMADLGDMADRVGVAVDDLQGLQRGFGLAGVSQDQFNTGLEKFVENIGEAATGAGAFSETLAANHIAIKNIDGTIRDTGDILADFADLVNRTPDAAARMALVTEAFGRGGKAMAAAFEGGSAALDKMQTDAVAGGYVLDAELIAKAQVLDDKFDNMTRRAEVFFKGLVVGAADAVVQMSDFRASLDEIFETPEQAAQILGKELAAKLIASKDLLAENQAVIEASAAALGDLAAKAGAAAGEIDGAAYALYAIGDGKTSAELAALVTQMLALTGEFKRGEISAEAYAAGLTGISDKAGAAMRAVDGINGVDLSGAIAAVGDLGGALQWLVDKANSAAVAVSLSVGGIGGGASGGAGASASGSGKVDLGKKPGGGRRPAGGGGGGASRIDALLADLQTEREVVTAWYAESLELLNGATEAQLAAMGGRHGALERLEAEHLERLRGLRDEADSGFLSRAGTFFGSLATLTEGGTGRIAKVHKVAAAGEAFVNVLRAQAQVLADPKLGFWAKLPAVAAIGGAGMKIVSALGGGGSVKGVSASGAGGADSAGGDSVAAQGAQPMRFLVQGLDASKLYTGQMLIDLTTAIQKELGNRGLIMEFAK